jgi:hypothetical protein
MNAVTMCLLSTVVSVLPDVTLLPLGPPPTPENPPPGMFSPFFVLLQEDSKHTTSSGDTKALVGGGKDGASDSVVGLTVEGSIGLSVITMDVVGGNTVEGVSVTPGGAGVVRGLGAAVVCGDAELGVLGWDVLPRVLAGADVGAGDVNGFAVALVVGVEVDPVLGATAVRLTEVEVMDEVGDGTTDVVPGAIVEVPVVVEGEISVGFGVTVAGCAVVALGAAVTTGVGAEVNGTGVSPGIGMGVGAASGGDEVG